MMEESFLRVPKRLRIMPGENCHEMDSERGRPSVKVSDLLRDERETRTNKVVWGRSYPSDSLPSTWSDSDHSLTNSTGDGDKETERFKFKSVESEYMK
jgi:hypothetical protein